MPSFPVWSSKQHHYDITDQEEATPEVKRLYEVESQDGETHEILVPRTAFEKFKRFPWLKLLLFLGLSGGWTYFVGATSYRGGQHGIQAEYQKLNVDVQMVRHTFVYDDAFPKPPKAHVNIHHDEPWSSLYPAHGPYFNKSATNPERWTFSVFHQLHCVNRLRHGYWRAHTAAKEGKPLGDEDNDRMISPEHIQHCLDYLRQSLMCHGDTTLEPDDVGINGAHGFGIQHNCKDWRQLLKKTDDRVLGM